MYVSRFFGEATNFMFVTQLNLLPHAFVVIVGIHILRLVVGDRGSFSIR
jgi:hypothetical protein